VTPEVIAVALIAGLAGGAIAAVVMGSVQAWMARGRGGGQVAYAVHRPGPPPTATLGRASSSAGTGPFDRFNESGKRVLALAQDEAIRHNHNYIGTEHLLAALIRVDGNAVAARALTSCGIELEKVRTALEFIVGRGDQPTTPSEITLSPRTKKVIELAIDESRRMGQSHIGAEHILLGVVREGEGIASGVIESLGVSLPTLRMKVLELLAQSGSPPPPTYAAPPPPQSHASGPFSRFTDRAKRVLALAQDEAIRMGHAYIGPEHLLLGLARLAEPAQADPALKRIFDTLGLTLEQMRAELGKVIPPSGQPTLPSEITLSPETKEVLYFVHESAGNKPVVPEDLLLSIVRDEQSFGAQLLARLGVTPERVRAAIGH
jgi:ATP-dependent Clp protease ATP-binding subunit ClpA